MYCKVQCLNFLQAEEVDAPYVSLGHTNWSERQDGPRASKHYDFSLLLLQEVAEWPRHYTYRAVVSWDNPVNMVWCC
jgi:hypothetical protein